MSIRRNLPKTDMTEEFSVDANGDVIRSETGSTTIDRYEFLHYLAEEKLEHEKNRILLDERIKAMQAEFQSEDARIGELYRKIIPNMSTAEKEALKENNPILNNRLAEAWPNLFEKVVPTVVAKDFEDSVKEPSGI